MIAQADAAEAEKPWNKRPALWFVITEIIAVVIVLYTAWYFDLYGIMSSFVDSLID